MGCESKSLNGLLQMEVSSFMMMTGNLLPWIQKLAIQHFTLEV